MMLWWCLQAQLAAKSSETLELRSQLRQHQEAEQQVVELEQERAELQDQLGASRAGEETLSAELAASYRPLSRPSTGRGRQGSVS